jgi:electron transfer flavoprotein beta subunit
MHRVMKYKNVEVETMNCDDIGAEADRCGFAGSPTSVNKIVSVVLAGGDYKEVAPTAEGITSLVDELVKDHTIG